MKYLSLLLLPLIFTCNAYCQVKEASLHANTSFYTMKGNINGKIPVFMWFATNKSGHLLYGQVTYTNTQKKEPLYIVGKYGKQNSFFEYDKKGEGTGHWEGKIVGQKFIGKWYATKSEKSYPFELSVKDTLLTGVDTSLAAPPHIDGEYSGTFPDGYGGSIEVKKMNDKQIRFSAMCTSRAPALDIAQVDPEVIPLNKNVATHRKKNDSGMCNFMIKFYRFFAVVEYACETCTSCEFGMSASVNGIYIKTSDKPDFSEK